MSSPNRLGRYAVQRRIGSGGFATVWLAYDDQLDSPVAVKVLADNWTEDAQVRRRFLEEGRYLRRVESPHVVTVYDAGVLDDDRPYLVMTYADQGTLADRLELGSVTPAQGLEIIRQIALGLQALHDRDILHRDVKPANVLFRSSTRHTGPEPEIRAMLGDLGLGKALDVSSRLTMIAGTPSFVAPEQASAEPLDARADQYSLAALSYLLITGRAPFTHTSLHAAASPPPVPAMSTDEQRVSGAVEDVVRRGLSVSPADRYPSVTEFADALVAASDEHRTATLPAQPWLPINSELTLPGVRPTHGVDQTPGLAPPPTTAEPLAVGATEMTIADPKTFSGASPAPAAPSPTPRSRRRWLRRGAVAAALVVIAGGAGVATYAATRPGTPKPSDVTVTDDTGKISVTVPPAWDAFQSTAGWTTPIHQANQPRSFPAVSVGSSDIWNNASNPGEGVFASIIPGSEFPDDHHLPGHPDCTRSTPQETTDAHGAKVITTAFTACPAGVVIEQLTQLDDDHQLWVQIHSDTKQAAFDVLKTVTTS